MNQIKQAINDIGGSVIDEFSQKGILKPDLTFSYIQYQKKHKYVVSYCEELKSYVISLGDDRCMKMTKSKSKLIHWITTEYNI